MADELKFEEALGQLEKLVVELESGDLGLDEAMKRFEKGVKLSRQLEQTLETASRKVETLSMKDAAASIADSGAEPEPGAKPKRKGAKAGQDSLF